MQFHLIIACLERYSLIVFVLKPNSFNLKLPVMSVYASDGNDNSMQFKYLLSTYLYTLRYLARKLAKYLKVYSHTGPITNVNS